MARVLRNGEVADAFDLLADLSELLGEQGFRVLAYRRAATRIRDTAESVVELALAGEARNLQGIGRTIEEKIVELATSGRMEALEKRQAEVPPELTSFLRLPGLGPKTAARIWHELGVTTLAGLKEAAEAHRIRDLHGMGAKSEEKLLRVGEPRPQPTQRAARLPEFLCVDQEAGIVARLKQVVQRPRRGTFAPGG